MLQFNFSPFPVLETERLMLRQVTDADLPVFFKMRTDKRIMRYIDRPMPENMEAMLPFMEQIKNGVAENKDICWAIEIKGQPGMIGQVGFWRTDLENHRGEVGYMIQFDHFGKGYASEALAAALDYGFDHMSFHSVKGNINVDNAASARVLEKAGFLKEAHFREDYYFNGKFLDSVIYCTLKSDWDKRRGR